MNATERTIRRTLAGVGLVFALGCHPRADGAPQLEISTLDGARYLVVEPDGTIVHGSGERVGSVDTTLHDVTIPPDFVDVPLATAEDMVLRDTAGLTLTPTPDERWTIEHSGRVLANGEHWGNATLTRSFDDRHVAALIALYLYRPPQPIVARVRLVEALHTDIEVNVVVSALPDGRIVEGEACPTWQRCDLGPEVGRWDDTSVSLGALSASLEAQVTATDGRTLVRPLGDDRAWFFLTDFGGLRLMPEGPVPLSVKSFGGDVAAFRPADQRLELPRTQAVLVALATLLEQGRKEARATAPVPPPPPPPPPM